MQPYFLPYLGYWQLIQAADRFVIYDDVNYIPRGWVNRNRVLINGKPAYITLPLQDASQNKKIHQIQRAEDPRAPAKMLRTIELAYRRAPGFAWAYPSVESLVRFEASNLADFLANQIKVICRLLNIQTEIVTSSRCFANAELSGADRIVDLCRQNGATRYLNLPGGRNLYRPAFFGEHGIELEFISMESLSYQQLSGESFVPNLSIADAIMCLGRVESDRYLRAYKIEP